MSARIEWCKAQADLYLELAQMSDFKWIRKKMMKKHDHFQNIVDTFGETDKSVESTLNNATEILREFQASDCPGIGEPGHEEWWQGYWKASDGFHKALQAQLDLYEAIDEMR